MSSDVTAEQILKELTKRSTWEGFFRTPCVQSSYLWGMGCGALMVAHKLRLYKGKVGTALNFGFFTFLGVSSLSFLNCTTELRQRTEMIQNAFKQKDILPAEKK